MFCLLVFLHVEYFLGLLHCLLLQLLELLHLLGSLLFAEARLKLGLKLWLDDGCGRVAQGHRDYLVVRGLYWLLGFWFSILGRFLLEIVERKGLGLRLDSDCLR